MSKLVKVVALAVAVATGQALTSGLLMLGDTSEAVAQGGEVSCSSIASNLALAEETRIQHVYEFIESGKTSVTNVCKVGVPFEPSYQLDNFKSPEFGGISSSRFTSSEGDLVYISGGFIITVCEKVGGRRRRSTRFQQRRRRLHLRGYCSAVTEA